MSKVGLPFWLIKKPNLIMRKSRKLKKKKKTKKNWHIDCKVSKTEEHLITMGFDLNKVRFAIRLKGRRLRRCITFLLQDSSTVEAVMAANPEILQDMKKEAEHLTKMGFDLNRVRFAIR